MLIDFFLSALRDVGAKEDDIVDCLAFSPNGLYLATGLNDDLFVGFLVCFTLITINLPTIPRSGKYRRSLSAISSDLVVSLMK